MYQLLFKWLSNEISSDNGTKTSVTVNDSGSNGFITFSTDNTENTD